jgi:hypothetical protein
MPHDQEDEIGATSWKKFWKKGKNGEKYLPVK